MWRPSHRRHLARQPGGASKPCCLGQSTSSRVAGSSGSAPPFSSSSRSPLEGSATPHLQRASLPLYLNLFNKSYSIVFETFSHSRAYTRVHSTRHPQPLLQIALKIRARNWWPRWDPAGRLCASCLGEPTLDPAPVATWPDSMVCALCSCYRSSRTKAFKIIKRERTQTVKVQCKLYRAYRDALKPYACVHHLFFSSRSHVPQGGPCFVGEVVFFSQWDDAWHDSHASEKPIGQRSCSSARRHRPRIGGSPSYSDWRCRELPPAAILVSEPRLVVFPSTSGLPGQPRPRWQCQIQPRHRHRPRYYSGGRRCSAVASGGKQVRISENSHPQSPHWLGWSSTLQAPYTTWAWRQETISAPTRDALSRWRPRIGRRHSCQVARPSPV